MVIYVFIVRSRVMKPNSRGTCYTDRLSPYLDTCGRPNVDIHHTDNKASNDLMGA